jgi:hypothetical protein
LEPAPVTISPAVLNVWISFLGTWRLRR